MDVFEWVLGLMFAAATLSLIARRLALPYPSLLAVGGAAIALLPYSPDWTLDPRLALTLFVAPVLLDAAYDFSLRDLRRNWFTVAGLAVMAVLVTTMAVASVAPTALLVIVGSVVAGYIASVIVIRLIAGITDVPIAIIIQFVGTFGVWILADNLGRSGVLTIDTFAILALRSPTRLRTPPQVRIPTNAVWAAVVYVLNALAFVLIGMQLRPILGRLGTDGLANSVTVALAVLVAAVVARFAWVMAYNLFFRAILPEPKTEDGAGRPTVAGGLVISWAGMRGIVTLAAAFANPTTLPDGSPFPYRDLILLW